MSEKQEKEYQSLDLSLGVFFSSKELEERNSLSIKRNRDGYKFKFTSVNEDGSKLVIEKRITVNAGFIFKRLLSAVLLDRQVIAKQYYENGNFEDGIIPYSTLPELDYEVLPVYFSKDSGTFINTGKITVSTVDVNGTPRVAITGYDRDGKSIKVVLLDDSGKHMITRVSEKSVVDTADLDFYRFCYMFEKAQNDFIYAGFDKMYQMLKIVINNNEKSFGNNNGNGKLFGFFKKKDEIPQQTSDNKVVEVYDSDEDGSGIF